MPLNPQQKAFLEGLRIGDLKAAGMEENSEISDNSKSYLENFKNFLRNNNHPNPHPHDLYLVVKRRTLIRILNYANKRNILGLQYCYGFDRPINDNGRMQLINIGTIPDHPETKYNPELEEKIFNSNFKMRNLNGHWKEEHFLNFNLKNKLLANEVTTYTSNFQAIYTGSFRKGSLLPVKALLGIFTDFHNIFGSADSITFRWGINKYKPNESLGDFILIIGIGDTTSGPVIERIINKFNDPPGEGDCPLGHLVN